MDFFAQQEQACRRSAWLTACAAAFAAVVVAVTGLVFAASAWCVWFAVSGRAEPFDAFVFYPPVAVCSCVLALIVVLTAGAIACQRARSGNALMLSVGARRARRAEERRLFNVVEEMSIASGADMPDVWVVDDDNGVNAFAAGYGGSDSAVCLTAGALKYLARDELQGVVAHEFGHILNGDMRFNSHLALLVEGLSGISTLGRAMLKPLSKLFAPAGEDEGYAPMPRNLAGSMRGAGATFAILTVIYFLTGCALWLLGCAGEFFARILQLAASREREYLADAAAVQFTRDPEGLAKALRFSRLLAGHQWRGRGASALNICHMFFVGERWCGSGMHPPVKDRVRRLSRLGLSAFDREFRVRIAEVRRDMELRVAANYERYRQKQDAHAKLAPEPVKLPPEVAAQLGSAAGAGVVLASLLRGGQVQGWNGPMNHTEWRVLANRAVAAIRSWGTDAEVATWADRIESLAQDGGEMGSFGFMVWCSVRRRLRRRPPERYRRPAGMVREVSGAVATIAALGSNGAHAWALARRRLDAFFPGLPQKPEPYESSRRFVAALDAIRSLAAPVKREIIFAIRDVVAEDGVVTDDEVNYLAAVADSIGACGWDVAGS